MSSVVFISQSPRRCAALGLYVYVHRLLRGAQCYAGVNGTHDVRIDVSSRTGAITRAREMRLIECGRISVRQAIPELVQVRRLNVSFHAGLQ